MRMIAGAVCAALMMVGMAIAADFKTAPEARLSDLDGKEVTLSYGGSRLTLVNFWATWCLPCREEMPDISRLQAEFEKRGFRAVGVALESGSRDGVREFLKEHPELDINYTMLMGSDTTIDDFGGIELVPTTYLIDSEGGVVDSFLGVGAGFHERVGRVIREFLDGPPAPEKKP